MKKGRKSAARRPAVSGGPLRRGKPPCIRVCVVDDHPLLRSGIAQRITKERDMTVCCEAGSAEEALRLLEGHPADVALVDITLPDQDGFALIGQLIPRHPGMHIIVLSMHNEAHYADRALKMGATAYVTKTTAPDQLVDIIRRVHGGEHCVSSDVKRVVFARPPIPPPEEAGTLRLDRLCERELEVFQLIGQARTTREIAEAMGLSVNTVDSYRSNIKRKLGLRNTTELIMHAAELIRSRGQASPV